MALYIDSAFLNDIIQVTKMVPVVVAIYASNHQSEQAVEKFTRDWQNMKML